MEEREWKWWWGEVEMVQVAKNSSDGIRIPAKSPCPDCVCDIHGRLHVNDGPSKDVASAGLDIDLIGHDFRS